MAASFDIGDAVTLTATFRNQAGSLADPDAVVCKVKQPDGITVSPSTTRAGLGVFTAVFLPDQDGEHWSRFEGIGAVTAAEEKAFIVNPRHVTG